MAAWLPSSYTEVINQNIFREGQPYLNFTVRKLISDICHRISVLWFIFSCIHCLLMCSVTQTLISIYQFFLHLFPDFHVISLNQMPKLKRGRGISQKSLQRSTKRNKTTFAQASARYRSNHVAEVHDREVRRMRTWRISNKQQDNISRNERRCNTEVRSTNKFMRYTIILYF